MAVFVNTIIILAIISLAAWQLVKVFKRAKKGKCAACDYDCVLKKQVYSRHNSAKI
ncbi:FeoB-associated Cys-rich membrane protein [Lactobacillus alvi]|uniref:FeoB-associated Cys-rich membrane protein n=1 Tax=Limosilactobacillus alvi TaxID=990412 RepID=A0ABS2ER20_9LACO|nr:FeoB-associated Cys-rich membrane protein [Limosilactobacillus alvi]MBM6754537.1 FeoB-associated Cys-rich membrane protein [Limosilactobacillus alvi]